MKHERCGLHEVSVSEKDLGNVEEKIRTCSKAVGSKIKIKDTDIGLGAEYQKRKTEEDLND